MNRDRSIGNVFLRTYTSWTAPDKIFYFALGCTAIFFIVGLFNILNHEMWRDELQAWLLARESTSVTDLFHNIRYEGHPGLWHLVLFFITRLTHNPVFMQVAHLFMAAGAVFLFVRYAPFRPYQKFLFLFGYYPLYEYAAVSRNYSIGLVLMFAVCAVYFHAKPRRRYTIMAVLMFLLAHTNIYGLLIVLCLLGYFLLDILFNREKRQWAGQHKIHLAPAVFIAVVGVVTSLAAIIPPEDTGYAAEWYLTWDAGRAVEVLGSLYKAFVPIPQNTLHYWDSHLIQSPGLLIALSLFILAAVSLLLRRTPAALLLYLGGTLGFLTFMYIKYIGFLRHQGHLFILLLLSLWLAGEHVFPDTGRHPEESRENPPRKRPPQKWATVAGGLFITLLLAANAYAGLLSSVLDGKYVFSRGKETAGYIKANGWENSFIGGHRDYAMITVTGFLPNPMYYPRSDRMGNYIIWNNQREPIGSVGGLKKIKEKAGPRWKDTILVLNFRPKKRRHHMIRLIKAFEDCVVPNEKYYICKFRY